MGLCSRTVKIREKRSKMHCKKEVPQRRGTGRGLGAVEIWSCNTRHGATSRKSSDGKQDVDDKVRAENERTQPPITNRVRMWNGKCLLYRDLEEKHIAVHETDRLAILEETAKLVTETSMEATNVAAEAAEKSKAVAGLVTEAVERSVLPSAMRHGWVARVFHRAEDESNTLLKS